MGRISEIYKYNTTPICNKEAVVQGEKYRFSILTPSLIRMEYSDNGVFEDRATSAVTNREFPVPHFEIRETEETIKIYTDHVELTYHKKHPFCSSSLTARFYGDWGDRTNSWRFENTTVPYGGVVQNYWGTLGQLDEFKGPVPLEKGFMSPHFTEWDDSKSMIIADDGWVDERPDGVVDTYLFAYREKHLECLHDFLALSGKIPMLPRYALGNWWSRYHKYTADEYKEVINKFSEKGIPLSVACLDMDWHITDIDKKYGTGWSGYTWNDELIGDHKELLNWLHSNKLEVMLNLHDREGIAPHEKNYIPMAKELGIDWESGQKINFDFGNPKFVEAYFKYTHHNNEEEGVTFWWVDGFPENSSNLMKADIPWMLNHYHYVDNTRNGKRGMLLSRNCGIGGQRYGIGFSGDTQATWEMLDFLPYFTSTASNVGFGWWSHDVGGFMHGIRSDEMMVRWAQFAAFSPIFRLHSTNNPFMSKEPWNYNEVAERVISDFMRLRHKMIPYIYTMNYGCYADNITLIRPLYYYCPNHSKKNEYYFGDEMIVAPITTPMDSVTVMGHTNVYLPEGMWFDFFSSRAYKGARNYTVYRSIYEIPVFVKAGGIIPLSQTLDIDIPQSLEIDIFPGDSNVFELYEDDGITLDYQKGDCAVTAMELKWSENPEFIIKKPQGNLSLIPQKRNYKLCFRKTEDCKNISVKLDGKDIPFKKSYKDGTVIVEVAEICGELTVKFEDKVNILKNDYISEVFVLLMKMQSSHQDKEHINKLIRKKDGVATVLSELSSNKYDNNFRNALTELIFADAD